VRDNDAGLSDALEREDFLSAVRCANNLKQIKLDKFEHVVCTKQIIARSRCVFQSFLSFVGYIPVSFFTRVFKGI
jgi:hypothetical protein